MKSLDFLSFADCDQLCAADKSRFGKKICTLSTRDLAALAETMKTVLAGVECKISSVLTLRETL